MATISRTLRNFLASEAAGGLILMGATAAALLIANTGAAPFYFAILETHALGLSVLHWVNDVLMTLFFLLVGLEIRREIIQGQLSSWPQRALPGIAALSGIVIPGVVFIAVNLSSDTLRGWAIPTATDIAFALGILSLLGNRIPTSLKVFLAALAILDDLVAIVVIAIFYSDHISAPWILGAVFVVSFLRSLNYIGERRLAPYLAAGALLWVCAYMSGLHATLAGVVLALTIPLRSGSSVNSPALKLEHALQPVVAYAIVPLFGLANAGLSLSGVTLGSLLAPLPMGIALGLFFGKQIGIFSSAWLAIKLKVAALPEGASFRQVYGVALLCGIGFTMSLFIGLLAFPTSPDMQAAVKLGVLTGSIASAIFGALVLMLPAPRLPNVK